MIKGLWDSLSGMLPRMTHQEVAANNLANVNSTGFKKDRLYMKSFIDAEMMAEFNRDKFHRILEVESIKTDHSQGLLQETDNPLDLAILGNGFFTILTPQGEMYTRNGNFMINSRSQLVTAEDQLVLDVKNRPINIREGKVFVNENGEITIDGARIATLKIVDFEDLNNLEKSANNSFTPRYPTVHPVPASDFLVKHGFLERSNVTPVAEMVNMIVYFRNYEADSRILQAQDDTLRRAVNDVGRYG